MGELGDDIIFSVDLTTNYTKLRDFMRSPAGRVFRVKDLDTASKVYRSIWGNVYFPLQNTVTTGINTDAPKFKGDLRDSLKRSIKVPLNGKFPLTMILNTAGIHYAKPVNKMPSGWLKHPTAAHSNVRKGRILVDPKARGGWYGLILLNGRNRARKLWRDYVRKTWAPLFKGISKNPTNEANKLFKVKFR
jgi:hypothetical protein